MPARDAPIEWTPQLIVFVQTYVLTGDTEKALKDAQLPEDFNTEAFLADPIVSDKITELREAALAVAMQTDDLVKAEFLNWAQCNVADYLVFQESAATPGAINAARTKLKDLGSLPATMQKRIKKISFQTTQHQGEVVACMPVIELHDPMKAMAEFARLHKIGEEVSYSARDRAQQLHEFLLELEGIHNVRDGEFPPESDDDV